MPAEGWSYTGMVGKAPVPRLLQLAGEQMRAEPWVLQGKAAAYEDLARQRRSMSKELTDYYAGKGPRPQTGHLP